MIYLIETNLPGVLAVGDIRHYSVKRIASAVGEDSHSPIFTLVSMKDAKLDKSLTRPTHDCGERAYPHRNQLARGHLDLDGRETNRPRLITGGHPMRIQAA